MQCGWRDCRCVKLHPARTVCDATSASCNNREAHADAIGCNSIRLENACRAHKLSVVQSVGIAETTRCNVSLAMQGRTQWRCRHPRIPQNRLTDLGTGNLTSRWEKFGQMVEKTCSSSVAMMLVSESISSLIQALWLNRIWCV